MQPAEPSSIASTGAEGAPCPSCGLFLAPALLVCPQCQALVHRAELEQLAAQANAASARGELADAMASFRRALLLLPAESKQYAQITAKVRALRERLDAGEPSTASPARALEPKPANADAPAAPQTGWRRFRAAISSAIAVVLFKLKALWWLLLTGWKPVLLGLTKLSTLSTMLLSLGLYWNLFGWQFALGLVVCIYLHEIGHVVALKRLGIAASSPMFIPGFGAFVRMQQYPIDPDEEAQVSLAGPRWGLGVSLVAFLVGHLAHSEALTAIAKVNAWFNLLNLIPVPPLDGGYGFRAFSNQQRLLCAAAFGAVYAFTHQSFPGIIALIALFRSFEQRKSAQANARALIEYIGLGIMLSLISLR